MAVVQAAMLLPDPVMRNEALGKIEAYRSRGHGEGCFGNKRSDHCVAHDKRAAVKARNRRRSK